MSKQTIDPRVRDALLSLLEQVEKEDEYLRVRQASQFKKNNLFWHGFQYLFWSDVDQDWRIPTHQQLDEVSGREETKYIFDYVINHFKAHGESIIAALSADIPEVQFGPRDAQDPSDRRSVDAADNVVELIEKWNRAKLLIINALFYLATEGFVAAYTYNHKDPNYGVVNIPEFDTRMEQTTPSSLVCPSCGYTEDQESQEADQGADQESQAQEEQNETADQEQQEQVCPQCGAQMEPQEGTTEEVPFMSGSKPVPKGREIVEIYGPMNVRVSPYVTRLADSGYLIHYVDADPALFKGTFQDVADEISSDSENDFLRSMRQSALVTVSVTSGITKITTQKKCWFRPWMFNRLGEEFDDIKNQLQKLFPTGIYCSFVNRILCEMRDESMDEHWTVTKAGPSKGIHADPLLQSEVPLQELRNNLINLFVMQVEYGVPATYADTEVFDFEGQSKQEVSPGYIYPVTPRPGKSLSDAFYSERTATLSKESTDLLGLLTQDEQFVTGSYPSIYGGPSTGGSKTLGEYDKSRSFALQRLSLTWYFLNVWYAEVMHKCVLSFIKHQIEDEPLTQKVNGAWQTKWIRAADLKGSFDRLEPEASADFPISFAQKRQTLMALAQLNNPEINSVLFSPENAEVVQSYVGLRELRIPSEIQRNKQIREIMQLIGLEPAETLQGQMSPAVPVEPLIDDHSVHIQVCVDFLCSDTGQDLKESDPQSYAHILAHLIEHKQAMMPPPGIPVGGLKPGMAVPGKPPGPVGPPPPEAAIQPTNQPQGANGNG